MSASRTPPQSPNTSDVVVQRLRVRYGKHGPLRFASHRDVARAFERALRRCGLPVAYSGGFTPHPRISYQGAAPTGVASEAEYLEIGLSAEVDPAVARDLLTQVMPGGFAVHEVVTARGGPLADRIDASQWRIEVDAPLGPTLVACRDFLAADTVTVQRLTKDGRRELDVRGPVVSLTARRNDAADDPRVPPGEDDHLAPPSVILDAVVRQVTPTVRPDDLIAGICAITGLSFESPVRATRVRQGLLRSDGGVTDALAVDRP